MGEPSGMTGNCLSFGKVLLLSNLDPHLLKPFEERVIELLIPHNKRIIDYAFMRRKKQIFVELRSNEDSRHFFMDNLEKFRLNGIDIQFSRYAHVFHGKGRPSILDPLSPRIVSFEIQQYDDKPSINNIILFLQGLRLKPRRLKLTLSKSVSVNVNNVDTISDYQTRLYNFPKTDRTQSDCGDQQLTDFNMPRKRLDGIDMIINGNNIQNLAAIDPFTCSSSCGLMQKDIQSASTPSSNSLLESSAIHKRNSILNYAAVSSLSSNEPAKYSSLLPLTCHNHSIFHSINGTVEHNSNLGIVTSQGDSYTERDHEWRIDQVTEKEEDEIQNRYSLSPKSAISVKQQCESRRSSNSLCAHLNDNQNNVNDNDPNSIFINAKDNSLSASLSNLNDAAIQQDSQETQSYESANLSGETINNKTTSSVTTTTKHNQQEVYFKNNRNTHCINFGESSVSLAANGVLSEVCSQPSSGRGTLIHHPSSSTSNSNNNHSNNSAPGQDDLSSSNTISTSNSNNNHSNNNTNASNGINPSNTLMNTLTTVNASALVDSSASSSSSSSSSIVNNIHFNSSESSSNKKSVSKVLENISSAIIHNDKTSPVVKGVLRRRSTRLNTSIFLPCEERNLNHEEDDGVNIESSDMVYLLNSPSIVLPSESIEKNMRTMAVATATSAAPSPYYLTPCPLNKDGIAVDASALHNSSARRDDSNYSSGASPVIVPTIVSNSSVRRLRSIVLLNTNNEASDNGGGGMQASSLFNMSTRTIHHLDIGSAGNHVIETENDDICENSTEKSVVLETRQRFTENSGASDMNKISSTWKNPEDLIHVDKNDKCVQKDFLSSVLIHNKDAADSDDVSSNIDQLTYCNSKCLQDKYDKGNGGEKRYFSNTLCHTDNTHVLSNESTTTDFINGGSGISGNRTVYIFRVDVEFTTYPEAVNAIECISTFVPPQSFYLNHIKRQQNVHKISNQVDNGCITTIDHKTPPTTESFPSISNESGFSLLSLKPSLLSQTCENILSSSTPQTNSTFIHHCDKTFLHQDANKTKFENGSLKLDTEVDSLASRLHLFNSSNSSTPLTFSPNNNNNNNNDETPSLCPPPVTDSLSSFMQSSQQEQQICISCRSPCSWCLLPPATSTSSKESHQLDNLIAEKNNQYNACLESEVGCIIFSTNSDSQRDFIRGLPLPVTPSSSSPQPFTCSVCGERFCPVVELFDPFKYWMDATEDSSKKVTAGDSNVSLSSQQPSPVQVPTSGATYYSTQNHNNFIKFNYNGIVPSLAQQQQQMQQQSQASFNSSYQPYTNDINGVLFSVENLTANSENTTTTNNNNNNNNDNHNNINNHLFIASHPPPSSFTSHTAMALIMQLEREGKVKEEADGVVRVPMSDALVSSSNNNDNINNNNISLSKSENINVNASNYNENNNNNNNNNYYNGLTLGSNSSISIQGSTRKTNSVVSNNHSTIQMNLTSKKGMKAPPPPPPPPPLDINFTSPNETHFFTSMHNNHHHHPFVGDISLSSLENNPHTTMMLESNKLPQVPVHNKNNVFNNGTQMNSQLQQQQYHNLQSKKNIYPQHHQQQFQFYPLHELSEPAASHTQNGSQQQQQHQNALRQNFIKGSRSDSTDENVMTGFYNQHPVAEVVNSDLNLFNSTHYNNNNNSNLYNTNPNSMGISNISSQALISSNMNFNNNNNTSAANNNKLLNNQISSFFFPPTQTQKQQQNSSSQINNSNNVNLNNNNNHSNNTSNPVNYTTSTSNDIHLLLSSPTSSTALFTNSNTASNETGRTSKNSSFVPGHHQNNSNISTQPPLLSSNAGSINISHANHHFSSNRIQNDGNNITNHNNNNRAYSTSSSFANSGASPTMTSNVVVSSSNADPIGRSMPITSHLVVMDTAMSASASMNINGSSVGTTNNNSNQNNINAKGKEKNIVILSVTKNSSNNNTKSTTSTNNTNNNNNINLNYASSLTSTTTIPTIPIASSSNSYNNNTASQKQVPQVAGIGGSAIYNEDLTNSNAINLISRNNDNYNYNNNNNNNNNNYNNEHELNPNHLNNIVNNAPYVYLPSASYSLSHPLTPPPFEVLRPWSGSALGGALHHAAASNTPHILPSATPPPPPPLPPVPVGRYNGSGGFGMPNLVHSSSAASSSISSLSTGGGSNWQLNSSSVSFTSNNNNNNISNSNNVNIGNNNNGNNNIVVVNNGIYSGRQFSGQLPQQSSGSSSNNNVNLSSLPYQQYPMIPISSSSSSILSHSMTTSSNNNNNNNTSSNLRYTSSTPQSSSMMAPSLPHLFNNNFTAHFQSNQNSLSVSASTNTTNNNNNNNNNNNIYLSTATPPNGPSSQASFLPFSLPVSGLGEQSTAASTSPFSPRGLDSFPFQTNSLLPQQVNNLHGANATAQQQQMFQLSLLQQQQQQQNNGNTPMLAVNNTAVGGGHQHHLAGGVTSISLRSTGGNSNNINQNRPHQNANSNNNNNNNNNNNMVVVNKRVELSGNNAPSSPALSSLNLSGMARPLTPSGFSDSDFMFNIANEQQHKMVILQQQQEQMMLHNNQRVFNTNSNHNITVVPNNKTNNSGMEERKGSISYSTVNNVYHHPHQQAQHFFLNADTGAADNSSMVTHSNNKNNNKMDYFTVDSILTSDNFVNNSSSNVIVNNNNHNRIYNSFQQQQQYYNQPNVPHSNHANNNNNNWK